MARLSGQQGVPVIVVNGEPVVGFDQRRLTQLLSRAAPKLGASIADAASQARKQPGVPAKGAYVGQVRPDSPAARAGLRVGDVITGLGGQAIERAEDVHRLVAHLEPKQELAISFVRDGREHQAIARL